MIELADLIEELRAELDRARQAGTGSELRFGLGPVELEVTVALGREGKTGGKIKFWVAEVNADGKLSSTSTQRIKLTLNPTVTAPGEPAEQTVSAAAAPSPVTVYVGGDSERGER